MDFQRVFDNDGLTSKRRTVFVKLSRGCENLGVRQMKENLLLINSRYIDTYINGLSLFSVLFMTIKDREIHQVKGQLSSILAFFS